MKKYFHQGAIDSKNIVEFVENYKEGKLEVTMMTEEVPENNNGPVKILVGTNFDDIV
jgi:hypothetical protein